MSTRYDNAIRASLLALSFVITGLVGCSTVAPKPVVVDTQADVLGPISPELQQSFSEALVLLRDQKFSEAEQQLLLITANYPNFSGPWTNLAIAQNKQQKYAEALGSLEKALQQDVNFCQAVALKGLVLREMGQFQQAKQQYQQALVCDPNDLLSLFNLGVLADLYLYDEPAALHYYERYLAAVEADKNLLQSNDEAGDTANNDLKAIESWVVALKRRVPEENRIKSEVNEAAVIAIPEISPEISSEKSSENVSDQIPETQSDGEQ